MTPRRNRHLKLRDNRLATKTLSPPTPPRLLPLSRQQFLVRELSFLPDIFVEHARTHAPPTDNLK